MNVIDQLESDIREKMESVKRVRRVMNSYEGLSVRNQMFIDFVDEMGDYFNTWYERPVHEYSNYYVNKYSDKDEIVLHTPPLESDRNWEEIEDKINIPIDSEKFGYQYEDSKEIDGVTFLISGLVKAKLPEKDKMFLIKMGKIKEEIIPSSIETTLTCDIN